MKYCKKCFRNVREDVNVCPYCGAPGLEEYGSQKSGEDFTCSQPAKTLRDIKQEIDALNSDDDDEDDVYSTKDDSYEPFGMFDDEKTDAYGNVKKSDNNCSDTSEDAYGSYAHTDNCDNAPDDPYVTKKTNNTRTTSQTSHNIDPNNPNIKMRIEYLNMLKKIDGISQERIDELMRRYDESHGKQTVKSYTRTATHTTTGGTLSTSQANIAAAVIGVVVAIFIGFMMPFFGVVILASVRKKLKILDNEKMRTQLNGIIIIFMCLFVIMTLVGFFSFIASAGLLDTIVGEVFNV